MDDQQAREQRKLSWFSKLIIFGVIFIVVIGGPLLYLNESAESQWQAYMDELRAKGEPMTISDLEQLRPPIPDNENAAVFLMDLGPKVDASVGYEALAKDPDPKRHVFVFGRKGNTADFFEGLPRYAIEESRSFLETRRELLTELAKLRGYSRWRFNTDYQSDPLLLLDNNPAHVRAAGKLVHLDCILSTSEGRFHDASESILLQFHLADGMTREPTIIARLVQIAMEALALRSLEGLLSAGEVDTETLDGFMTHLDTHVRLGSLRLGLQGERVHFVNMCTFGYRVTFTGPLPEDEPFIPYPNLTKMLNVPGLGFLAYLNLSTGARMLTALIDAADDPKRLLDEGKRMEQELDQLGKSRFLVKTLLPSLSRACLLNARIHAELDCARCGVAAERFRLKTGRMPESLSELVPEFLEAVPIDPFDGQPLRFKTSEEGIVIYTIDDNEVDDGGSVTIVGKAKQPLDRGFRLNRPEHRGLKILDIPPPTEEE
ncbi:MAG: hypothetical protein AABZ47_16070 [Planctomycetota bacterium]